MRAAGDAVQGRGDAGVHGGRRFRGHRVRNGNATVPVRRASGSDGRLLRRQEERVGRSEQGARRLGRAWRQRRDLATVPGRGVRGTRTWFAARWARGDRRVGADLDAVFDKTACDAIRERLIFSRGDQKGRETISLMYPLMINNLVTAALNSAAALGFDKVSADIIREA